MIPALQALSLAVAIIAWLTFDLANITPDGWQDDAGFHFGEPDDAQ